MVTHLWLSRHGVYSCGWGVCGGLTHNSNVADWSQIHPQELAELATLAAARRETLRCQCGAVEYNPAARTLRDARDGDTP